MMDIKEKSDKVYVLTIERNSDRHEEVKRNLSNFDFEFWYGFDAKVRFPDKVYVSDIDREFFFENDIDQEFAFGSTLGQLGAYFSIKQIIDFAFHKKFSRTFLFEDDMMPLVSDWETILEKAFKELPSNWDILLMGYLYDGKLYRQAYHRRLRWMIHFFYASKNLFFSAKKVKIPARFSKHLDLPGYSTGGHALCFSKKGVEILHRHLSPMRDSGDLLIERLIRENKINAYSVYPCLFRQNPGFGSKTNSL